MIEKPVDQVQAPDPKPKPSMLRALGTVSGVTLISRVLGLFRDVLMASAFGLSTLADAFYVAWTLPNLFRRLCGEGALSSAFVPVYIELKEKEGSEAAQALANVTVTRLAVVLGLFLLVGETALWLIPMGLGSLSLESTQLETLGSIIQLSRILLPYLWFICLAGLLQGLLHSEGEFFRPAFMAVVLNIVWIAALLLTTSWFASSTLGYTPAPTTRIQILAAALVFGGLLQFSLQLDGAKKVGAALSLQMSSTKGLDKMKALFLPLAFGMAIEQLNVLSDRFMAWFFVANEGGVTALYYSMRLIQLPISLIGTTMATVLFPAFARILASEGREVLNSRLAQALRITLYATLPAAIGLCLLAPDLIELLFERGQFGASARSRTALCLLCYATSVVMISLSAMQIRAFHAQQDGRTPVKVGALAVVLNLVLNLILVRWMAEAGLALATSLSATFSFCALYVVFGAPHLKSLLAALGRTVVLCLGMALVCMATRWLLSEQHVAFRVIAPILTSVIFYGALSWSLSWPEFREALALKQAR